jgi:surfeit locus 1 family protein
MPSGYSFRPRARRLALAAAACAALILLGNWQTRRADEKRALGAELEQAMRAPAAEVSAAADAPDLVHKRVGARGSFVPQHTVLLDNKLRHGRPGYEVVTPLRLSNSGVHVLVNRGWIEAPRTRDVLPKIPTPAGELRVEGVAFARLAQALRMKGEAQGPVRQNLDIGSFVAETGLPLKSIVIEQHSETNDGLLREWPRPDLGIEKHESYALQWYSLAALAVTLAAVFSFRRK